MCLEDSRPDTNLIFKLGKSAVINNGIFRVITLI